MKSVRQTEAFAKWAAGLKDADVRRRISVAVSKLRVGLGDIKPLGGGLFETRLPFGPGYRLYFVERGEVVIVLLIAGTKRRQSADIRQARAMAEQIREDEHDEDDGV